MNTTYILFKIEKTAKKRNEATFFQFQLKATN